MAVVWKLVEWLVVVVSSGGGAAAMVPVVAAMRWFRWWWRCGGSGGGGVKWVGLGYLINITRSREDYLNTVVPLYDAIMKCNWKSAKAILEKTPALVRSSITGHQDTPLHVAVSAKGDPAKVKELVENLVDMMKTEDLELQNKNSNTALYLAAVAGEVEPIKIMLKKNKELLKIPGGKGKSPMMPLYAAALFGNYDVVKYIYKETPSLSEEEGWDSDSRQWLLETCVENDMFLVAMKMVENHNELACSQEVLGILARKREAFEETRSNIMVRTIKSAFKCFGKNVGAPEKESALPLLRLMWGIILKEPKRKIDDILRGPADLYNRDTKRVSGWAVQAFQLKEVIRAHVERSENKPGSTSQGANPILIKNEDIKEQLQNLSKNLMVMHAATQNIIENHSNLFTEENKPVSNMENLALELQKLIFNYIADMNDYCLEKSKQTEVQADKLKESISILIQEFDKQSNHAVQRFAKTTHSSRVLFVAAEAGNTTFLVELIRQNPDLIWKQDDNGLSIFHVAARHRHRGIYNILYELGAMKDLITPLKDRKDNNMLHLVAKIAQQKRLEDVSGVALQMQLELLWFNEVKKVIPATYRETENADGLTPHELFTKEHKDLITQGEKWMKDTASQCMVVAALIATIVFAATFTVPGGYDQTTGIPIFHSKATFSVFVVADAISLVSSSASILIFLSILTSRYAEQDYSKSLPRKLTLGLATLFLSITTMMVAFGVSFFVLYKEGLLWMPILICAFVVLPAFLYLLLQGGLFMDVFRSAYRSKYLFKPNKPVLYYENPKV